MVSLVEAQAAEVQVVALRWDPLEGKAVLPDDPALQRSVVKRLGVEDVAFAQDHDLAQSGRVEHPAATWVSMSAILTRVKEVAETPPEALPPVDWLSTAIELGKLAEEVGFVETLEQREVLFLVWAQAGRATALSGAPVDELWQEVGGQRVPRHLYLAATLAWQTPQLLKTLAPDLRADIEAIDEGAALPFMVSFDLNNQFDPEDFLGTYEVFVSGLQMVVRDPKGKLDLPLGQWDVALVGAGGLGLSERLSYTVPPKRPAYVVQNATKRIAIDAMEQLVKDPDLCRPALDEELTAWLALTQERLGATPLVLALPFEGSTSRRLLLWEWDRDASVLRGLDDDCS